MSGNVIFKGNKDSEIRYASLQNTGQPYFSEDLYSIVFLNYKGNITINFENSKIADPTLIFLCPGEILKSSAKAKCPLISISNKSKWVENRDFVHLFGNFKKWFRLTPQNYEKLLGLFAKIQDQLSNYDAHANVHDVFSNVLKVGVESAKARTDAYHDAYNFIGLVHRHYKSNHEMSFYAEKMNTSAKRIAEKFHSYGVPSPHEIIKKRILTEVKRQLLFTNNSIQSICFDVGFGDPAYFSRFFKKNTGIAAKNFRNAK